MHVSENAMPSLKRGIRRVVLEDLYIPNIVRNSWAQLGLLILSWKLQQELEPTRRECISCGGEQVLLDWFIPHNTTASTPIVVYIPGITGRLKEASAIVQRIQDRGLIAVVFHRRGHEEGLRKATFNIFGSAQDLRTAVEAIHAYAPEAPVALVGSSAGSAVMVRYLGQFSHDAKVVAGVGLSPGYDIQGMWTRITGTFFDRYLTKSLKEFFLERNRPLLVARDLEAVRRLEQVETVNDFAKYAAAFSSEHKEEEEDVLHTYEEWLEKTCPLKVVLDIRTPTLCLNALDDPICHKDVVETVGLGLPHKNPSCAIVVTENGSHCAHQSFGGFKMENWGHTIALDFIEGVLSSED